MADQEDIQEVQDMLGPDAEENGFDANRIEELLDAGRTASWIAASYWEKRYAATSNMIDISESGSSRGLSAVTRNAKDLAALYRSRADQEVAPTGIRRGIVGHKMRRV